MSKTLISRKLSLADQCVNGHRSGRAGDSGFIACPFVSLVPFAIIKQMLRQILGGLDAELFDLFCLAQQIAAPADQFGFSIVVVNLVILGSSNPPCFLFGKTTR